MSFFSTVDGDCAGDAFLAGSFADMAAYPPAGLGLKHGFLKVEPEDDETPEALAHRLLDDDASPFSSATGPAGCVPLSPGQFLFFGRARRPENNG